jgi:hypothetical protein
MKHTLKTIKHFKEWVEQQLQIENPAKVELHKTRNSLKTYADYSPSEGVVRTYISERSLADCLRSIAHELVHHKQNEEGRIKSSYDVELEDEANAYAGRLIRAYANEYPESKVYDTVIKHGK